MTQIHLSIILSRLKIHEPLQAASLFSCQGFAYHLGSHLFAANLAEKVFILVHSHLTSFPSISRSMSLYFGMMIIFHAHFDFALNDDRHTWASQDSWSEHPEDLSSLFYCFHPAQRSGLSCSFDHKSYPNSALALLFPFENCLNDLLLLNL